MSMINREVSDFRVCAFRENKFRFVSKEDVPDKWSVFFFYPSDFTFVCLAELADPTHAISRDFQACQSVHAHGDQLCPANRKPGAETMKSWPDPVGWL